MKSRKPFPFHVIVFLAPATLVYTAFMIYPLLDSLRLSMYAPGAERVEAFVGLANYQRLVSDPNWAPFLWNAIRNNFLFFAVHMLVQNPLGLLLAALLSSQVVRFRALFRTVLFLPTVLSIVLVGFIWRLILSPIWGISKDFLGLFGAAHLNQPWLGLEATALVTLSLISVWQWVGIPMLLFLAALVGIPDELIEAALLDGATMWQTLRRVVLPAARPGIVATAVLAYLLVWNDFFFALVITRSDTVTAPVAIMNFVSYASVDWGSIAIASIVLTLPTVPVIVFANKYIVQSMGGAVKG